MNNRGACSVSLLSFSLTAPHCPPPCIVCPLLSCFFYSFQCFPPIKAGILVWVCSWSLSCITPIKPKTSISATLFSAHMNLRFPVGNDVFGVWCRGLVGRKKGDSMVGDGDLVTSLGFCFCSDRVPNVVSSLFSSICGSFAKPEFKRTWFDSLCFPLSFWPCLSF